MSMYINQLRLPDQITLVHGPRDILGRYFLLADQVARDLGVRLRLRTDFESLVELNERHRDSWPPIIPSLNPHHSNLQGDMAFWIEGIDELGDTVITHASRLFDWPDTTLDEELRSLRVFYDDPAPHVAAGECVDMQDTPHRPICGRTMYGGAVWVRPDHRGRGLNRIVPRVSRAYGYTRWKTDSAWTLTSPKTVAAGLTRATGPFRTEKEVVLRMNWRGVLPSLLLSMDTAVMLSDFADITSQATIESSRLMETPSMNRSPDERRQGMSRRS